MLQFERCRELCRTSGVAMFVDPEYEADDIIGTLALHMRDEGVRSAFITRDKDLAQLMRNGDLFWDYGARDQFGYHDIERHFGVAAGALRRLPGAHRRRGGQHSRGAGHRPPHGGLADEGLRLAR